MGLARVQLTSEATRALACRCSISVFEIAAHKYLTTLDYAIKVASVSAFATIRASLARVLSRCGRLRWRVDAGHANLSQRNHPGHISRSWRDAVGGACIRVPLVLRRGIKRLELQSHW